MPRVQPGEMRWQIHIQRNDPTRSKTGGTTPFWTDLPNSPTWAAMKSAPASLRAIADAERTFGGQPAVEDIRIFTIWYREDVAQHDRIMINPGATNEQTFDILNVSIVGSNEQLNEQLELMARSAK